MEAPSRIFLDDAILERFGFRVDPFDLGRGVAMWVSPGLSLLQRKALAAMKRQYIAAISGPAGAGKSLFLRHLRGLVVQDREIKLIEPASIDRRTLAETALTVAILRELTGRDTSGLPMETRSRMLQEQLQREQDAGNCPTLVIDEAHLLTPRGLLAIKRIWDSYRMDRQLAVILMGQPPLTDRLRQDAALHELALRTNILSFPLLLSNAPGGTASDYLGWRCKQAGRELGQVFEPAAVAELGRRTQVPMVLHSLAARALVVAWQQGDAVVTAAHVGHI